MEQYLSLQQIHAGSYGKVETISILVTSLHFHRINTIFTRRRHYCQPFGLGKTNGQTIATESPPASQQQPKLQSCIVTANCDLLTVIFSSLDFVVQSPINFLPCFYSSIIALVMPSGYHSIQQMLNRVSTIVQPFLNINHYELQNCYHQSQPRHGRT